MKEKKSSNIIRVIFIFVIMIIIVFFLMNLSRVWKNTTNISMITKGSLSYEEQAEGYIIRDEIVLEGENSKNGMVQILSDGERTAKNEPIFRYFSSSEENILNQIAVLDSEINEVIEDNSITLLYADIASIEKQIEDTIDVMYNLNYLQKIQENKNKIETLISKKTQITGTYSPSNSYVKTLTDQRNVLEKQLEMGSEVISAPISGLASYRIDGLEEILKTDNFDYLSTDLLNGFELKVGAIIPLSNEKGKIVNNFEAYIATSINTEKAMNAKVGDVVTLRLSNSEEIDATIVYIKEENENNRILVFKISEEIANLLEYRKISLDIIWWKYSGLKVSNSALIEENDRTYLEINKAGNTQKVLVKVLRQNDTYSIIENYEKEELINLGYTEEEISEMSNINLYDEVILH